MSKKNDSFLPTFNHAYAAVDGLRVHYVEAGEGMPVLLLPGWLQTWYACRDLILPLTEVSSQASIGAARTHLVDDILTIGTFPR